MYLTAWRLGRLLVSLLRQYTNVQDVKQCHIVQTYFNKEPTTKQALGSFFTQCIQKRGESNEPLLVLMY